MKSIKFSDKELEFIRQQYQVELEEAETYVENIKNILNKIGVPSTAAMEEPIEQEPKVIKRRGRKPKVKKVEPKIQKKRGRPKAVVTEPIVQKKRARKSKAVVPTNENAPVAVAKRGRKPRIAIVPTIVASLIGAKSAERGRKPKVVVPTTESKEPKKRGRKPKISVPTSEPKKRGRKPRVSAIPASQPKSIPTAEPKVEKKIVKKKPNFRKKRSNWGGVRLSPMSKPFRFKEPEEEPEEETAPIVEPIVVPNEEPIITSTEETIIAETEEPRNSKHFIVYKPIQNVRCNNRLLHLILLSALDHFSDKDLSRIIFC